MPRPFDRGYRSIAWALIVAGLLLALGLWQFTRTTATAPAAEAQEVAGSFDGSRGASSGRRSAPPEGDQERPPDGASAGPAHTLRPAKTVPDPRAPHGSIAGRVVNWSTGHGVGAAELLFTRAGESHAVITQPDGAFVFAPPTPGRLALSVITADGYLPYAPEFGHSPIVFTPRTGHRVDGSTIYLFPAVDYLGRVVDEDDRAVVGARVQMYGAATGERELVGIPDEFDTDESGEFRFHAADDALFEATHPDHGRGRARLDAPAQISHELVIRLSGDGPRTAMISGRVVDSDDVGLAGARVSAQAAGAAGRPPDGLQREAHAITGDDGSFALEVDDTRYDVRAWAQGLVPRALEAVEAGTEDLTITLVGGGTIRGRVVEKGGGAVPAATVSVAAPLGRLRRRPVASVSVFDATGAFEVAGLEPGTYVVQASAYGFARSGESEVTVVGLDGGPELVLELDAGGSLVGEVVDEATNEPLVWARVTVEGQGGGEASVLPAVTTGVTDAEGRFELRGIPAGRHGVMAVAFRHHGKVVSGIDIAAGASAGPISIALAPLEDGERAKTELFGIGVALEPREDALLVTRVLAGGGAAKANIVEGDSILSADGEAVAQLGFEGAIQAIRGPDGTTVALGLRRRDGKTENLTVRRGPIESD